MIPKNFQEDNLESLDDYRKRMNITFGYKPTAMNPEFCRNLNEADCEQWDLHTRELKEQRQLQQRAPATGTQKVLVLLIDIVPDRPKPPREHYEMLFNGVAQGESPDDDVIPTGSIQEYYTTNSYGAYDVEFFVQDWVNPGLTESYCAGNNQGLNPQFAECFYPALQLLEDQGFTWFEFDQNQDGFIGTKTELHCVVSLNVSNSFIHHQIT